MSRRSPRHFDQARNAIRRPQYSRRTERTCVGGIRRFTVHNGMRDPRETGARDVEPFPNHLAVERKALASTQNQALSAFRFLFTPHAPKRGEPILRSPLA